MRALRLEAFGPVTNLQLREIDDPPRSTTDLVIAVRSSGVNPSDVANVAGRFTQTTLPRTPGRDYAGVVAAGDAAWIGAEVWGVGGTLGFTTDGTHAEFVRVPLSSARRKPARLPLEAAGAIGVPFTTAWSAVVRAGGLSAGETLLIIGAAGAVGQAAAQIARWRGARVIGVDRRPSADFALDAMIDTTTEELRAGVRRVAGPDGVDVVLDTVGGPMFEPSLSALRHGGRLVAISSRGAPRVSFDLVDFYHRELTLTGVDSLQIDLDQSAAILDLLAPGFDSGALSPPPITPVPLDRAIEAYLQVATGTATGKVVIVPPGDVASRTGTHR
jgi:NADPH:quinone reductase-like Zn-dependent oxidoreductase